MYKILAVIPFLVALCLSKAIPIHAPENHNRLKLTANNDGFPGGYMRWLQPRVCLTENSPHTQVNDHPQKSAFDIRARSPRTRAMAQLQPLCANTAENVGSEATGGNYRETDRPQEEFTIPFATFL